VGGCNAVGASFDFAQDEDGWGGVSRSMMAERKILILSEVEGRTIAFQLIGGS
jgi:hypothetical protein